MPPDSVMRIPGFFLAARSGPKCKRRRLRSIRPQLCGAQASSYPRKPKGFNQCKVTVSKAGSIFVLAGVEIAPQQSAQAPYSQELLDFLESLLADVDVAVGDYNCTLCSHDNYDRNPRARVEVIAEHNDLARLMPVPPWLQPNILRPHDHSSQ